MVLYLPHAAALGYKDAVVRTPRRRHICDSTAAFQFNQIYCVPGHRIGEAQQIVNIKLSDLADSLGEDDCVTLLGYCVFSAEDCTSSFRCKVNVKPPKS